MSKDNKIRELEDARCAAMIQSDIAALDELFSETLIWTHSSGSTDSKAGILERVGSGKTRYLAIKRSNEIYHVTDFASVAAGIVDMDVLIDGVSHQLRSRYLNVWFDEQGIWRLVAWQSTPI